jgi:hypothetical protein
LNLGYLYLHGFASHAGSVKGVRLREALAPHGIDLLLPDLNVPAFETMTYTAILGELDRIDRSVAPERWRLVGSSMGGYLAARWAELRPARVDRLALLCPGFDLARRWPLYLGAEAFAAWERTGSHRIADHAGVLRPLHWEFVEDSRRHPAWPAPACPIALFHGILDDVVPVEYSREYARGRANVTYRELDDDHALLATFDRIAAGIVEFFGVGTAR